MRLRARKEFLATAKGHVARRKLVVIQAIDRKDGKAHIGAGFTATRKIGGAVIRNRAKRRLREAARTFLPKIGTPGADYVFIARRDTQDASWTAILDDVESSLLSLRGKLKSGQPPVIAPRGSGGRKKRPIEPKGSGGA